MNANEITSRLLIEIQKKYRDQVLCWRNNTGAGLGMSTIWAALDLLARGDLRGVAQMLRSRPISWGLVGSADIFVICPHGRFGGIEVKAPGDTQKPAQEAFETRLEALGGFYIIARDVEDTMAELEKRMKEER